MFRSVGSPAYLGEATTMWAGTSLRFVAAKNGSSARVLTMTAAADVIRATVHNRVDNQRPTRCVSGESPPPPIGPLPNRFTHCRVSRREQSLRPSPHRRHRECGGAPGGSAVGDLFAA